MPAGRPPKPTALHKLEGTLPIRPRHGEPQPKGAPVMPKTLKGDAATFWRRVVPSLAHMKVATTLDAPALERMCIWWAEAAKLLRQKDRERGGQWVYEFATADKQWREYASRFGLTPVDRAKLSVGDEYDHDPAAEFVA